MSTVIFLTIRKYKKKWKRGENLKIKRNEHDPNMFSSLFIWKWW